jgi:hypothetical protein
MTPLGRLVYYPTSAQGLTQKQYSIANPISYTPDHIFPFNTHYHYKPADLFNTLLYVAMVIYILLVIVGPKIPPLPS